MVIFLIICYILGIYCPFIGLLNNPPIPAITIIGFIALTIAITITIKKTIDYNNNQKHYKNYNSPISKSSNDGIDEFTIDDFFEKEENLKPKYTKKKLVTKNEITFGKAIKKALPEGYRLQPQICLASILHKESDSKFANELFRIIDFGVFDKEFNIIFLIEINDESHNERQRMARDYKVKDICAEAEIPLITFWTSYGVDEHYIKKRILQELEKTENIA